MTTKLLPTDIQEQLQLDAGVMLTDFDPESPTINAEKIAGVSSGGFNIICTPTITDLGTDIDNAKAGIMELQRIDGYECTVSGTFVTASSATLAMMIGNVSVDTTTIDDATIITPQEGFIDSDKFNDMWVVGQQGASGLWAVNLKNAFSTAGYSKQTVDKNKGTFAVTLTGHYAVTALDEVPMDFYALEG